MVPRVARSLGSVQPFPGVVRKPYSLHVEELI